MDYTDESGDFRLEFPFGTRRASIRLVDAFSDDFITKVHTVNFAPGTYGIVYDTVLLFSRPDPIEFMSTSDQQIEITTGDSMLGELQIPAESIYDQNGNLYEVSENFIIISI